MSRAKPPLTATLIAVLSGCSPPARSMAFFESHPQEIDQVLADRMPLYRRRS